jgi:hypothetical protein
MPFSPIGLHASSSLDAGNIYQRMTAGSAHIDLSLAEFVDVYAMVTICAIIEHNSSIGCTTSITWPASADAGRYLLRMGLADTAFSLGCIEHGRLPAIATVTDRPDRLIEVRQFSTAENMTAVLQLLEQRLPGLDAQTYNAVDCALGELADNVRYHAGVAHGYLAAQVYGDGDHAKVRLAIGDAGIGIRASLAPHHPAFDDQHALELAMTMLVSGTGELGRGQGLTTSAQLVNELGGFLSVRSGTSRRFSNPNGAVRWQTTPDFAGTTLNVTVPARPGLT